MIKHTDLKEISPVIPLDVLQKVQSFILDRTMRYLTSMIANKSLKHSTTVLTTGKRFYCRLYGCPTRSFLDVYVDRSIFIIEDSSAMRETRL